MNLNIFEALRIPLRIRYSWKNSGFSSSQASTLTCSSSLASLSELVMSKSSSVAASEVMVLVRCLLGQETGGEGLCLEESVGEASLKACELCGQDAKSF